jgi:hypothetical protein
MSSITKQKCDNCGKEVADRDAEIGWIVISIPSLYVSAGRGESGLPKHGSITPGWLDFHDYVCLTQWLRFHAVLVKEDKMLPKKSKK